MTRQWRIFGDRAGDVTFLDLAMVKVELKPDVGAAELVDRIPGGRHQQPDGRALPVLLLQPHKFLPPLFNAHFRQQLVHLSFDALPFRF